MQDLATLARAARRDAQEVSEQVRQLQAELLKAKEEHAAKEASYEKERATKEADFQKQLRPTSRRRARIALSVSA